MAMADASQQPEPEIVGEEFGGKWIAWDERNVRIVASGASAEVAKRNALVAGVSDPILEFVLPADAAFVGRV